MSYKTILVHIDAGDRWRARLSIAARLVQRFEAHLVGLHALSSIRVPGLTLPEAGPILTELQGAVEARALEARAEYERLLKQAGVTHAEWRASRRMPPRWFPCTRATLISS